MHSLTSPLIMSSKFVVLFETSYCIVGRSVVPVSKSLILLAVPDMFSGPDLVVMVNKDVVGHILRVPHL